MNRLILTFLLLLGGPLARAQSSPPTVSVAIERVTEGNDGQHLAQFTATLSTPSNQPVDISFSTANGSATAGEDYIATRGTFTIAAKARTGTFSVPIIGDTKVEQDETFAVYLASGTYKSLSPATYGLIINDDKPVPTPQPLGKIVFTSRRTGNSDVFVMNGDGSRQTNLTNSPGEEEASPQWSPDGGRIAFSSSGSQGSRINVMNADGSNRFVVPQPLSSYNASPQWSPDGSKLVFTSKPANSEQNFEIYVAPASTKGTPLNVSRNPKRGDYSPQWSPDGKQIVWSSGLSSGNSFESYVVVAPSDGSGTSRILTGNTRTDSQPRWSPKGFRILYSVRPNGSDNDDVWVMNSDGSSQTNLTRSPSISDSYPQWSPDGKRIAFRSSQNGQSVIVATNTLGENKQLLSKSLPYPIYPEWDPYSSRVAFVAGNGTLRDIYSVEALASSNGSKAALKLATNVTYGAAVDWTIGTIPAPSVTAQNIALREGSGTQQQAVFEVRLSPAPPKDVRLTFSTTGITAKPVEDYTPKNGSLVVRAGTNTATIAIPIVPDTLVEPDETFGLRLSVPGYASANPAAICTIQNDDATPKPTFTPTPSPTATSVPTSTPSPVPSGKISYVRYLGNGGGEIFVMNADGSNQTRLTNNSVDDSAPSLSADGRKIVFVSRSSANSGTAIYVMNADGSGRTQLTSGTFNGTGVAFDYHPQFSGDGSRVVYNSYHENNDGIGSDIYVMNADGSGQTQLTTDPAHDTEPTFSPDGSQIAFTHESDSRFGRTQIYIMNAYGGDLKQLTAGDIYSDHNPAFSQDGKTVFFSSNRLGAVTQLFRINTDTTNFQQVATDEGGVWPSVSPDDKFLAFTGNPRGGGSDIYIINADGGGQRRLTTTGGTMPSWSVGDVPGPSASSTSGKIAFTVTPPLAPGISPGIYVMNADGSNQTRLTNNGTNDGRPRFSADGNKIVFVSTRDGNFEIYSMNSDGSNQTRLTSNSNYDSEPTFSPDGSKIVFISDRDGSPEIYLMNFDGSNQIRLTYDANYDSFPIFSPDGRKIFFTSFGPNFVGLGKMNLDGTEQTFVSREFTPSPAFSPDGDHITFSTGGNGMTRIYVLKPDGTGLTQITNDDAQDNHPSYSPDSSSIAFSSNRGGMSNSNFDIYTMNASGTRVTRLTKLNAFEPSWAPGSVTSTASPNPASPKRSAPPSGGHS